jgi:hypothetical protein
MTVKTSEQVIISPPERRGLPLIGSRARLDRRTVLIGFTVAGVTTRLFFGWDWLAAAGLTSFAVGLLPCAAMCAAGLCANRLGGKCHGGNGGPPRQGAAQREETP